MFWSCGVLVCFSKEQERVLDSDGKELVGEKRQLPFRNHLTIIQYKNQEGRQTRQSVQVYAITGVNICRLMSRLFSVVGKVIEHTCVKNITQMLSID